MFKLPNKFYRTGGGGSSGTTTPTSNKKYEITITQPPEHEPMPDFIRGIPYSAKDSMMFCKCRKMTLDDVKEIKPDATEVPGGIYILQDINSKDLIITSDQIEKMLSMQVIIIMESDIGSMYFTPYSIKAVKKIKRSDSKTMAAYVCEGKYDPKGTNQYCAKISDVDFWITL